MVNILCSRISYLRMLISCIHFMILYYRLDVYFYKIVCTSKTFAINADTYYMWSLNILKSHISSVIDKLLHVLLFSFTPIKSNFINIFVLLGRHKQKSCSRRYTRPTSYMRREKASMVSPTINLNGTSLSNTERR